MRAKTGHSNSVIALLCVVALIAAAAVPTPHVPRLLLVLSDHAEMVAEHGHSHGLEEDIAWALHGHSHEKLDHDHFSALLPSPEGMMTNLPTDTLWRSPDAGHHPPPVHRELRPPRA